MAGADELKVRAGFATVAAASASAVAEAIATSNAESRLEGLPDTLNPGIIDPAKAEALLRALPGLPPDMLAPLAGRALYLNAAGLRVGASAPTTPASFAAPFRLEVEEVQGQLVIARATVPTDCGLARTRAAEARQQTGASELEVKALEARRRSAAGKPDEGEALRALSSALSRRSAAANAWRQNADAVAHCSPGDAVAAQDLAEAKRVAAATVTPPHTGMPAR